MDYRELRNALLSKGQASESRARHHVFYYIDVDGKIYRATKFSHSARGQISDDLLGAIARQMRLRIKELRDYVECTITREQWLQLWRDRGNTEY